MVTFDPPTGSGGIEGRAMAYTESMLRRSVYVEVAALSQGNGEFKESYMGTQLVRLSSSILRLPRTMGVLASMITRSSLDSVFLLSGGTTPAGVLLLGYCYLTRRRSAVLFYGKDILRARRRPIEKVTLGLSLLLAGGVGANSKYTARLLPFHPRGQLTIIYPGVGSSSANGLIPSERGFDQPRILFVGRLVRRKGVDLLLSSFKRLKQEFPNLRLDIVGDGPEAGNLRALAHKLGLGDSVAFYGALFGPELRRRYAEATIFVMPSRDSPNDTEGFGTVFLEAGAFGVPSIGTRVGGIPEAIVDGVTGILVESENPEQLAGAIRSLLESHAELERLGKNAKNRAAGMSWEASTDMLLRSLRQV
jgi:glycosyltransferase involved in cell wall biosynthesis